jgi:hypothetical protein
MIGMVYKAINDLCGQLGISGREIAELLHVPYSVMAMAAAGKRQLPNALTHSMNSLWTAMENIGAIEAAIVSELPLKSQRQKAVNKELRRLRLQAQNLVLQIERLNEKLTLLNKRCVWLPGWIENECCKKSESRNLAATLLLRKSLVAREKIWIRWQDATAKLDAVHAAVARWESASLQNT